MSTVSATALSAILGITPTVASKALAYISSTGNVLDIVKMLANNPAWSAPGGYAYKMNSDKSITITKSPTGKAGSKVYPGSASYNAIVSEYVGMLKLASTDAVAFSKLQQSIIASHQGTVVPATSSSSSYVAQVPQLPEVTDETDTTPFYEQSWFPPVAVLSALAIFGGALVYMKYR